MKAVLFGAEDILKFNAEDRVNPYVELIRKLRQQGYRTGILLGTDTCTLNNPFRENGLAGLFHCIIASSVLGVLEIEPLRPLEHALQLLGVCAQEVVLVNDVWGNGASELGMCCIGSRNASLDERDLRRVGVLI